MFRFAALALLVTGCLDFSVGRYWRCNSASDCAGGWYCAGDGVCRPPGEGRASACAVDAQCAPGWRCNVVGVCQQAQSVGLTHFGFGVRQLSPLVEVTRVVASPSLPDSPTTTTTRLFVDTRDGGWLMDLHLDLEGVGEGVIQLSSKEVSRVASPLLEDEVALTDEVVSSRGGQLCLHDATTRRCMSGGGLLRSTTLQTGNTLSRGLLVASGSGVERRPGGRWDVGGPVVDLAGVQAGTCEDGLVATVSVAPDRLGVLFTDGGFPSVQLGAGERARRVRHAGAADRTARVLLEVGLADGGTVLDLYALACAGALRRLGRFETLCQSREQLVDFAWLADDRLERVCGDEVLLLEPASEGLDRSRIDTSAAGLHVAASETGAVRFGTTLQRGLKLMLEEPIESAFFLQSDVGPLYLARTAAGGTYGLSERIGLVLARSEPADKAFVLGTVTGLETLRIINEGLIGSDEAGLVFVPREPASSRRTAGTFGRETDEDDIEVVSFVGDGVRVGRTPKGRAGELVIRDRPAPGFDITSAAVRFGAGGAALASGFAVANGRLFSVTVSSTLRVTTAQLPLNGLEARVVRQAGDGFVAVLEDGRVVALPSLLPASPVFIDEGSIDSAEVWCGMPLVTGTGVLDGSDDVVSVLAHLENGGWVIDGKIEPSTLHLVEAPGGPAVWLSSVTGAVRELSRPGGCR